MKVISLVLIVRGHGIRNFCLHAILRIILLDICYQSHIRQGESRIFHANSSATVAKYARLAFYINSINILAYLPICCFKDLYTVPCLSVQYLQYNVEVLSR